jgi:hypothetical protein
MKKQITIKLTQTGPNSGPFSVVDNYKNIIDDSVTRRELIKGKTYEVDSKVTVIIIKSLGECSFEKAFPLTTINFLDYASSVYTQSKTACLWRHLTNISLYNNFSFINSHSIPLTAKLIVSISLH